MKWKIKWAITSLLCVSLKPTGQCFTLFSSQINYEVKSLNFMKLLEIRWYLSKTVLLYCRILTRRIENAKSFKLFNSVYLKPYYSGSILFVDYVLTLPFLLTGFVAQKLYPSHFPVLSRQMKDREQTYRRVKYERNKLYTAIDKLENSKTRWCICASNIARS